MSAFEYCVKFGKFASICHLSNGRYQLCIHFSKGNFLFMYEAKSIEELKVWWDLQGSPLPIKD